MAIVVRSERFNSQNSIDKIGPGEYFQTSIPLDKEIEENLIPFNTSTKRTNLIINKDNNKEIGPGCYYKNYSFIKNSFSTRPNNNKITFLNYALFQLMNRRKEQEQIPNYENLTYNSSNIKFNNLTNYNYYLESKTKSDKFNNTKDKKNIIILPTTKTKMRINSIPFKEDSFGYEIDNNGNIQIAEEPIEDINTLNININNIKNSSFDMKNKKKIHCVDWSKMSSRNLDYKSKNDINKNKKNKDKNLNNSTIDEKNEKENDFDNINTTNSTTNKSNNIKNTINKRSFSMVEILNKNHKNRILNSKNSSFISENQKKENFIYENLFNVQPGPGYYYNDNEYEKFTNPKIKLKDGFGSTEKKDKNILNNNNINLGPGSYFKTKIEIKKPNFYPLSEKIKNFNMKILNNSNDIKKNIFISEINEKVGPGSYNIKSDFDKIKKLKYNGPNEKRFNYHNLTKENFPGPGKYIKLKEWGKRDEILSIKLSEILNNIKTKEKEDNNIKNISTPGVGYYNPQIVSSIGYNILSKENKIQSLIAPFNSGQERFLNKSKSCNSFVGPGSYNINDSSFNFKIKSGIFEKNLPNQKYLNEKEFDKENRGPGSYEHYNYNDWNKKSFNVLFV